MLSKLLVVKNLGYFVKISMGHFYIFFSVGLDVNLQKRDRSSKQRVEKNWTGSTAHARNNKCTAKFNLVPRGRDPFGQRQGSRTLGTRLRQIHRVELICRVLICNLLGFIPEIFGGAK